MELPSGSSDGVAYPGSKMDIEDQEQSLKEKPLPGDIGSIEDAICSHGLKEKANLQLDQVRLSDGCVLEVQQLNKIPDFTVTDSDKNVTTNTSQEPAAMTTSSPKDEMVLCSGQFIYCNLTFPYLF